jgi:putative ABC transport system permease protein
MLRNFILVSFRNLIRRKFYTFINIAGLSIGLASAIFILLFVQDELSFDKQFEGYERIFRVNLEGRVQNDDLNFAVTCAPLAGALVADFPEVENTTRLNSFTGEPLVRYKENSYIERNFYQADSTFFELFRWPLLQGNASNALSRKNTIVISSKIARKYFKNEDPIGKMLEIGESRTKYQVTGIMQNWPANSHVCPELLASFITDDYSRNQIWLSNNIHTYVKLKNMASAGQLQAKFLDMVKKYVGPQMEQIMGADLDHFAKGGNKWGYTLIAISDIHLRSPYFAEIRPTGSLSSIYVFTAVAILLIIIACINFMNLSTAKSSKRSKEVALRKIFGSLRLKLMAQFIVESVVIALISLLIALLAVELLMPLFNQVAGKEIQLKLNDPLSGLIFIVMGLAVGILAGIYPALFLSSFEPVRIFRNNIVKGNAWINLRSILVIFQLAITIGLFVSTMVVAGQMHYIRSKKLGFDKDNILVIQRTNTLGEKTSTFKEEILKIPEIEAASYANTLPGQLYGSEAYTLEGAGVEGTRALNNMSADEDFQKTLNLEMEGGRWFSKDMPTDSTAIVVNETLIKACGINDPLGKNLLRIMGEKQWLPMKIIGIVKDFNNESLHKDIRPLVIWYINYPAYLTVRLNKGNSAAAIEKIQKTWDKFSPDQPFLFSFLGDDLLTLYKNEQRSKDIFLIFSLLSIFIAALGLMGIASFMAEQRTKEIGIRKVMGATIPSILSLMTREIVIFTGIATLISWIASYYLMKNWLEGFSYRINLSPLVFVGASLIALFIALATVSTLSYSAARANPADALHYE